VVIFAALDSGAKLEAWKSSSSSRTLKMTCSLSVGPIVSLHRWGQPVSVGITLRLQLDRRCIWCRKQGRNAVVQWRSQASCLPYALDRPRGLDGACLTGNRLSRSARSSFRNGRLVFFPCRS